MDRKTIDDHGIQEEVDTFVFTGHDTVSAAITYTFLCIAEHKDVQEKLYGELKDAFSKLNYNYLICRNLFLKCVQKTATQLNPFLFNKYHH